MKTIIAPLAADFGGSLEEIDISSDPSLEAQFGSEIPVLFINGKKAFKYRVDERELRRRLRSER